jgi:hypothetical protein
MNVSFQRGSMIRVCDREGRYACFLNNHKFMDIIAMESGTTGISTLIKCVDPVTRKSMEVPAFCIFYVYSKHNPEPIHAQRTNHYP